MRIIIAAAVIPALVLMRYIYNLDKVEREPIGLLILLVGAGAVSCFPAALIESILGSVLERYVSDTSELYAFLDAFVIVALAEEGCKFIFLKKLTWNNQEFNCNFDGIVYAVFVSLGFAALENIMYVSQFGLSIAIQRAILSIPGHMTFSVFMGHSYSKAKKASVFGDYQDVSKFQWEALIRAALLHGFYDYCLMSTYEILYVVFFVFVIVLDIISFKKIKEEAANDSPFVMAWPTY